MGIKLFLKMSIVLIGSESWGFMWYKISDSTWNYLSDREKSASTVGNQ